MNMDRHGSDLILFLCKRRRIRQLCTYYNHRHLSGTLISILSEDAAPNIQKRSAEEALLLHPLTFDLEVLQRPNSAARDNTTLCAHTVRLSPTYILISHWAKSHRKCEIFVMVSSNRDNKCVKCLAWTLPFFSWYKPFQRRVIAVQFAIKDFPTFAFSLSSEFVTGYTLNYTIHEGESKFKQIFERPNEGGRRGIQTSILHEFLISAHIYCKPSANTEVSERKASWPNSDSDLCDQYPAAPKKSNARKCQGLKMDGGGIGHWLVHPLCPRNQFILSPCPCACLEWGGDWNGVSAEASPHRTEPGSLFICLLNDVRGEEWMSEKIIRLSLAFNSPATPGGSGRGRRGCYYFPFIEEKIEACKCLMWGLMCRGRGPSVF